MFQSISKAIVVAAFVAAAAAVSADSKCSASARECDQQIRSMLSGRRFFGASVEDTKPGLVIKQVAAKSPADYAGLKAGDRLIAINGKSLTQASAKEYKQVLADARETGKLWIIVWRRGAYKKFEARLEPYTKEQIEKAISAHLANSHTTTAGAQ